MMNIQLFNTTIIRKTIMAGVCLAMSACNYDTPSIQPNVGGGAVAGASNTQEFLKEHDCCIGNINETAVFEGTTVRSLCAMIAE